MIQMTQKLKLTFEVTFCKSTLWQFTRKKKDLCQTFQDKKENE